ncbi:hypothetical protein EDD85DRAFT_973357 [Armillaria nabsnona]|nr:hypothetical protein EDD85DRAFT_973357 [Armillaria nabsnona]
MPGLQSNHWRKRWQCICHIECRPENLYQSALLLQLLALRKSNCGEGKTESSTEMLHRFTQRTGILIQHGSVRRTEILTAIRTRTLLEDRVLASVSRSYLVRQCSAERSYIALSLIPSLSYQNMSDENNATQFSDEIVAALESIQVLAHVEQTNKAAERGDIGNKDSGDDSNTDGESDSREKNRKRKRKVNHKHKKQKKAVTTSSESSSDSGSDSDKPQASYAWRFPSLTGAKPTLRPDVIEIRQLIQVYGKNIKKAKRDLRMSLKCPSLPDKLWTAILQDDVVDFDEIFTSINSATIDNKKTVQIGGGLSLALNTVKASTKITQHGHWVIAWQAYTEAVLFAFPSRRHELNAYLHHINKLFGVCHDSLHYRVINYDRAARIIIGSRRDVLFSDFHEFVHEKTAYIDSVGMAVNQDSVETSKKSVARLRTALQTQGTATADDICRNYNWGECHFGTKCRRTHACVICRDPNHVITRCPRIGNDKRST